MPEIFTKNCKIKVIEYSDTARSPFSWEELKIGIQSYISKILN